MILAEIIPSIIEVVKNLTGELILLLILFILRIIGIDLFIKITIVFNYLRLIVYKIIFNKKIIFIYTDADDNGNSTHSLSIHLEKSLQDEKIKCIVLKNSEDIINWPLVNKFVKSVIIILTDVVPLSSIKKKRDKIQDNLIKFALNGGILILGHDVLYRRSKNILLQKFCNVTLTKFFRSDNKNVVYTKNINIDNRISTNKILLKNLPDTLSLDDREYVTGDWSNTTEYIYTTNDEKKIPLVTRQELGKGVVFWINSGDHTENGPPPSIEKPSKDLIILLDRLNRYA